MSTQSKVSMDKICQAYKDYPLPTASDIKNREMIAQMRQKLARRKERNGYRLAAVFATLALLCGVALYSRSLHPKAPVHTNADQRALDELFRTLPR